MIDVNRGGSLKPKRTTAIRDQCSGAHTLGPSRSPACRFLSSAGEHTWLRRAYENARCLRDESGALSGALEPTTLDLATFRSVVAP